MGEGALIHELYKAGFTITDVNLIFVIVGETRSYNWDMMHKAAYFVANGAFYRHQPGHPRARFLSRLWRVVDAGIEKSPGVNRSMLVSRVRGSSARH